MKQLSAQTILRIFLPFAAGYFLSYLYRVVNAVIATDLVADTGIGPSDLGLLTASYFISFASFQLPLGVLLDRFGPRRTEAILLLLAGFGAFVFSQAQSLTMLIIGRALIGFGVSACLMASFKAYTMWFSQEKWPMVNGFQMAAGGLGALAATSPVEAMLGITDWRGIFVMLAVLTILVAVIVFLAVPEKKGTIPTEPLGKQLSGIKDVFTSLKFWQAAPIMTMSQASFLSIQGLWAGPWLRDVARMDRADSTSVLFWIAVSMIAGFILLGSTAERLNRRGVNIMTTSISGMGVFLTVQFLLLFCPISIAKPLWLMFGFFGTSGIIAYAALSQSFPVQLSGRVTTAVNLLVFIAAFAGQWAIGAIIGMWPHGDGGSYAPQGFTVGFGIMLFIQVLSLAWFFVAKWIIGKQA